VPTERGPAGPPDVTEDQSWTAGRPLEGSPVPGLVVVWSGRRALLTAIEVGARTVTVGRGDDASATIDDRRMSRRHAEVGFAGGRWRLRDLDSRNGTFVDGVQVHGEVELDAIRALRTGDTLYLPCADVRRFRGAAVELGDGVVIGPTLRAVYADIDAAAAAGDRLHVTGATGAGRWPPAASRCRPSARRPVHAVNCPPSRPASPRPLFGARKGITGRRRRPRRSLAAADGGTVLDEIASRCLRSRLSRARDREVLALGPPGPTWSICAVLGDPSRSRAGPPALPRGLYFRVGRPSVALPGPRRPCRGHPHPRRPYRAGRRG
jgi:hypothetical protein